MPPIMKKVFITFIFFITVIFFHAACMGQGNKSDINVIFIGNSITQGVLMEQPEKNAPPVRCAQYLADAPGIGNVEIFNAGLSGRTTVDFLPGDNPLFTRIADGAENLRARHPQALTLFSIMLGTNDSAGSGPNGSPVSEGDYKKNISLIVDSLRARFPGAVFVLHRPIWYSSNTHNGAVYLEEGQRRLTGYYNCLLDVVDSYRSTYPDHVFMGDTGAYDYFRHNHKKEMVAENGKSGIFYLHPNKTGAMTLGRYWADAILRVIAPATSK